MEGLLRYASIKLLHGSGLRCIVNVSSRDARVIFQSECLRLAVLLPTARLNTEMLSNKSFSLTLPKSCLFNLGSLTPSEITRMIFRRSEAAFSNRVAAEYTASSNALLGRDPR